LPFQFPVEGDEGEDEEEPEEEWWEDTRGWRGNDVPWRG
jgi:hypothetical protein